MRNINRWMLSLFVLVTVGSSEATSQTLPERFRGVWKALEGSAVACKRSDWGTDAQTDLHVNVALKQIDYYETVCRLKAVENPSSNEPDSAIRLTLFCAGEGTTWQDTQIWQISRIADQSILIAATTTRKREYISVYQKCASTDNPAAPLSEKAESAKKSGVVASLPLKRGFYVDADIPCGQASNATMLLVRRNGINGARELCEFKRVEQISTEKYRVTQACKDLATSGRAETSSITLEIANETSFKSNDVRNKRYCEQSSLPTPWRNNDITDLIK